MKPIIWIVRGTLIDFEGENMVLFEGVFPDREAAHAVYARGEKTYDLAAGFTNMRWTIEGHYAATAEAIEQGFEDVRDALALRSSE